MKTKENSYALSNRLLLLTLTVILAIFILPANLSGQAGQTPYVAVDEMPMFPGGEAALMKYIASNIEYPLNSAENNVQGKVIIRFCVTAEGGINQISVLKGVDSDLDKEAVRVVNKLPAFKPGKKEGVAVPVWYMVPITFRLATK
jgi:periplasmic protein TonB